MKNKKVLVFSILILLVIGISAVVLPQINKSYLGETATVFYPVENIKYGTLITEDMIREDDSVPARLVLDNAITDKEDIINSYAVMDLYKSDYFIKEKISNKIDSPLYEGKNLIAVSITKLSQAVAGQLKASDKVNIYGYSNNDEKLIFEELKNIEIAYLINQRGEIIKEGMKAEESIPSVVVFKIDNITQVKQLLELEYNANIHLERLPK